MKNLKNNVSKMLILLGLIVVFASCKKDKDEDGSGNSKGNFTYQSKTTAIAFGDYRSGNGDGAWIYFTGDNNVDFVQIRFSKLGDYVIPTGSFTLNRPGGIIPYDSGKNFVGGQVILNNIADEFTSGKVDIAKDGDKYTITVNTQTAKGPVTASFTGTLKKI